mmetsp:Transcript_1650/g.6382  ORF Transcript_1650/g.6382 Transcript_1650/m.6382 type:complete len:231 (-) Transcript_1650:1107-1799(-)
MCPRRHTHLRPSFDSSATLYFYEYDRYFTDSPVRVSSSSFDGFLVVPRRRSVDGEIFIPGTGGSLEDEERAQIGVELADRVPHVALELVQVGAHRLEHGDHVARVLLHPAHAVQRGEDVLRAERGRLRALLGEVEQRAELEVRRRRGGRAVLARRAQRVDAPCDRFGAQRPVRARERHVAVLVVRLHGDDHHVVAQLRVPAEPLGQMLGANDAERAVRLARRHRVAELLL